MRRNSLTDRQRRAIEYVRILADAQAADLLKEHPGCTPSRDVSLFKLRRLGIQSRDLDGAVRKGYLEKVEQFGPSYRLVCNETYNHAPPR